MGKTRATCTLYKICTFVTEYMQEKAKTAQIRLAGKNKADSRLDGSCWTRKLLAEQLFDKADVGQDSCWTMDRPDVEQSMQQRDWQLFGQGSC
jgi:hypothetical protein